MPTIPPDLAAVMATGAEHVLLILGLATRFSSLGPLGMTTSSRFRYPGAWVTHGLWAAALRAMAARGPEAWSLDQFLDLDGERAARSPRIA